MTSSNAAVKAVRLSTGFCASSRPLANACSVRMRWQNAWIVEIGATSRPRVAASRRSRAAASIAQTCGPAGLVARRVGPQDLLDEARGFAAPAPPPRAR